MPIAFPINTQDYYDAIEAERVAAEAVVGNLVGDVVGTTDIQTVTGKTIGSGGNTLQGADGVQMQEVSTISGLAALTTTTAPTGSTVRVGRNGPVLVGDASLPDLVTTGGAKLKYVPDTKQGIGALANAVYETRVESATDPKVINAVAGVLIGQFGAKFYSKTTGAAAWAELCDAPSSTAVVILEPMTDGEVIAVDGGSIQKSSGWGTGTVTWTSKVTSSGGSAVFLAYSSAGSNGVKMIVGEYATGAGGGGGWEDSKKAWATQDSGATWSVVYDAETLYPSDFDDSHLHGCCYDEWQDIFLVIEGHTAQMGIRWSADPFTDATDWTRIELGEHGVTRVEGQPTCIVPTDLGIVLASDAPSQGIWGISRGSAPADMAVDTIYEWPAGRGGTLGFGQCWTRDPKTGIVYMGYRHNHVPDSQNPLAIFASDGASGKIVWAGDSSTVPTSGEVNDVLRIAVTPWNTVEAQTSSSSEVGLKRIAGSIQPFTGFTKQDDPGGVLGGISEVSAGTDRALAVGQGSKATANNSQASGMGAEATASASNAVGPKAKASATNTNAIGSEAEANGSGSNAIGYAIKTGANSVVVGSNRDLDAYTNLVSIGATQTISQGSVVAVGMSVTVSAVQSVVVGTFSTSSGTQGTVLGHNSHASQSYSTVLGAGLTASAQYQVKLGTQHIEFAPPTALPGTPAAGLARLYLHDLGSGAAELRLIASNGTRYTFDMTAA